MNRETIERFRPMAYATPQPATNFRVWVHFPGQPNEYHYAPTMRAARSFMTDEYLEGCGAWGLEERESDGWHEWYDDKDRSICDIVG